MTSTNLPALQKLHLLDRSSSEFHNRLSKVLYGEDYQRCIPNLQPDDLAWLIDYLDTALNGIEPSSAAFRECLRELRSICGTQGILPTSYTLSPHLLTVGSEPFASGGYGDVYEGTLDGSRVCIKRLRVYTKYGPQKAMKRFCQEAVMWKRLTHPNILPLLGITTTPLQLVSNWMSGGDLPDYIKEHPEADRLGLLCDAANGLCFLHSCSVIHGDLKGPNILVDDSGSALIADFGLAMVTQNPDSILTISRQRGYTPQWTAPEILDKGMHSKEADMFSFAMVMIEAFTGAIPFGDGSHYEAVLAISQGRRPPRPIHPAFTTELCTLMERCWNQDPRLRPKVSEVLGILRGVHRPAQKWLVGSTYAVSPPMLLGDIQHLVDQIHKHCSKMSVAKEESCRLVGLCDDLTKRLSDPSIALQRSDYEDIKRNLAPVEAQLATWSKFSYPKSLMKRAHIKSGITGHTRRLYSILRDFSKMSRRPAILPAPAPSSKTRRVKSPDRGSADGTLPGTVMGTGGNSVFFHEPLRRPTVVFEPQESLLDESGGPPPIKRLDGKVTKKGELAFAGGTYCEVWVGLWDKGDEEAGREKTDPEKVALKALRAPKSSERARKRLENELPRWAELHHQNILPFYGIVTNLGPRLYMVSPWQENGNLLGYIKKTPGVNKNYLLCGSAAGLSYLHSRGVVHGSVKCKNVLVSQKGEPQICDFGLAKIIEESIESTVSKTISGEVVRYSAPELIENNNVHATKNSDAYSFGMLILECFTEKIPFYEHSRDAAVIHARISRRQCPPRPDGQSQKNRVSDDLWSLMKRCWSVKPDDRPTMEHIHSFFLLNV